MKKSLIYLLVISILILLFNKQAHMSKDHFREIPLPVLIKMSSYIAVVKKGDPEKTIQEIAIHPDKKTYPPFAKVIIHYRVVEVLFGEPKSLQGQTINVLQAYFEQNLARHKEYYLHGLSKSPIYQVYKTNLDYSGLNECIVFLIPHGTYFQFAVIGAIEQVSEKSRILSLIKGLKRNPAELKFKTGMHGGKWHDYQAVFTFETQENSIFHGEMKLTSGPFTGQVSHITLEQHTDGRLTITRHLDGDHVQIVTSSYPEIEMLPEQEGKALPGQGTFRILWRGPMTGYYGSGTGEIYQLE